MSALSPTDAVAPRMSGRNTAVDLVRAFCLVVVVGLHAMMAGVTVGANGLAITNALAGHPIFAWSTWAVQVMPLFFLLGGFSSLTQWRSMRAASASPSEYTRARVSRLIGPALLPIALVGGTLAALAFAGVSGEVLREVGFRIGQPLWFLAVYVGCAGLVPLMAALHERAPLLTILGLLGCAIAVDSTVVTFHAPLVGAANLLFVWLFVQQLGFLYADGWFRRGPRWAPLAIGIGSFGVLLVLMRIVGYSTDMYENLNPPTVCILVLGIGQAGLLAWMEPLLARIAARRPIHRAAAAVNKHSMTIYLWHLPVVVLVALSMLLVSLPMPQPLSDSWWQTRPLWLLAVAILLTPVVIVISRIDRTGLSRQTRPPRPGLSALSVVFAVAGVVVILIVGFMPFFGTAIALALLGTAVLLGRFGAAAAR